MSNVQCQTRRRRKLASWLSLDPAEIDERQSRAFVRLWVLYDLAWLPLLKLLWRRRYRCFSFASSSLMCFCKMSDVLLTFKCPQCQTRRRRNLRGVYLWIPHRLMSGNQGHSWVCEFSSKRLGFRSWSCRGCGDISERGLSSSWCL